MRSKFQKRNYENEFLYDKINDKFLYEELRKRKLEKKNHFLDSQIMETQSRSWISELSTVITMKN